MGDPSDLEASEPACRVFLAAFQLVLGMLLPALVLSKLYGPLAAAKAAAAADRDRTGHRSRSCDSGSSGASGRRGRQQPRARSWRQQLRDAAQNSWRRACEAGEAGEAAAVYGCQVLLNGVGSPLLTACAWWALASSVWNAALLLELPQYALSWPAEPAGAAAA